MSDEFNTPGGRCRVVVGQVTGVQSEGDAFLFTGRKRNFVKTPEQFDGAIDFGVGETDVKLDDFFTGPGAGVLHIDRDGQVAVWGDFVGAEMEIGIPERGVAQTEAERKRGLIAVFVGQRVAVIVAIFDRTSVRRIEWRELRRVFGKSDGEFAARVHIAKEDAGKGRATFHAGIPGHQNRRDFVFPFVEKDGAAANENYDRTWIVRGKLLDESHVFGAQVQVLAVATAIGGIGHLWNVFAFIVEIVASNDNDGVGGFG